MDLVVAAKKRKEKKRKEMATRSDWCASGFFWSKMAKIGRFSILIGRHDFEPTHCACWCKFVIGGGNGGRK